MTRKAKMAGLLLGSVGVVALFLPFTFSTSPCEALKYAEARHLALPAFLVALVWLLTLRSLLRFQLTRPELACCYVLATLAIMIPFVLPVWTVPATETPSPLQFRDWVYFALLGLLSLAGLGLLAWAQRRLQPEYTAPVALRCGYLPNAISCLFVFSGLLREQDTIELFGLQIGAAVVAGIVVLYLGEIVFLLYHGQQVRFASCPTASGPVNIRRVTP